MAGAVERGDTNSAQPACFRHSGDHWARTMLTAPIVEILRDLHHALVEDFWPCWLALSAVVVIGATWFVSRSSAPRSERRADKDIVVARRPVATPASIVALGVLAAFVVAYIAMTLVWEDFAYDDNS